jgi:LacI family transcriptional regulator
LSFRETLNVGEESQVVTLKEVAERAGVSIKTVSRIVNGDAAVNARTRVAVEQLLSDLNYVPNHAARQMRGGASAVVGLMTDAVATTPYSVDIVRGAQAALREAHQTLLIASSDGDPAREDELWGMFRAHRVSGVVYAAMYHRPHEVGSPAFRDPIVLANCFSPRHDRPSIVPDDEDGGYRQARYLIERGHRRIALLTLIEDIEATRLRGHGIRRAFAEAGLSFDETLDRRGMVGPVGREEMVAFHVAGELLSGRDRPSAIICGNDQVAMQVYAAAAHHGLSIPDDLSVMGFDDLRLISETLYPQLTTVALPYFEIGRLAVKRLDQFATEKDAAVTCERVPCPLVERNSCRSMG